MATHPRVSTCATALQSTHCRVPGDSGDDELRNVVVTRAKEQMEEPATTLLQYLETLKQVRREVHVLAKKQVQAEGKDRQAKARPKPHRQRQHGYVQGGNENHATILQSLRAK